MAISFLGCLRNQRLPAPTPDPSVNAKSRPTLISRVVAAVAKFFQTLRFLVETPVVWLNDRWSHLIARLKPWKASLENSLLETMSISYGERADVLQSVAPREVFKATLALPDFMSLDFDPQSGQVALFLKSPLSTKKAVREAFWEFCTIMSRDIALGGVAGLVGGTLLTTAKLAVTPAPFAFLQKLKAAVTLYGKLGSAIGGAYGLYKSAYGLYESKTTVTKLALTIQARIPVESSGAAAVRIMNIFLRELIKREAEETEVSIICPLSNKVMAYPAKLKCPGLSPGVTHNMDYISISHAVARGLEEQHNARILGNEAPPNPACPLCRHPIRLQDVVPDPDREELILGVASKVFEKIERILQRVPQEDIIKQIQQGQPLLQENPQVLEDKIKNPETLSSSEAYALSYFLVHQFKPLKDKINSIYQKTNEHLSLMAQEDLITQELLAAQRTQLEHWYFGFKSRLVPDHCPIVTKLYHL